MKYFIMLRSVDGEPVPVVDEIGMVQLFDKRFDAIKYATENNYDLYGYKIYEWSE